MFPGLRLQALLAAQQRVRPDEPALRPAARTRRRRFLVGATFFGLPLLYDLPPAAASISWTVAAVHLAMTLLTDYPAGLLKLIPLEAHLTATAA